jgi:histone deacetylase complex regulatory component SIN3
MFWTKNEKSLFNAGFKKHTGQLRNISLGLPSKSTSEVIDYHYRFKIPSQYRKYVKKKRTTSSTNGPGGSTSSTPFSSTSHSPFDNGSGPTAIDRRRHKQAKSFLSQCRRQLGPEAYLNVVNLLKSYSQKSIQMKNLRERVVRVIGGGELAKNFDTFLPKKHRGEEGA